MLCCVAVSLVSTLLSVVFCVCVWIWLQLVRLCLLLSHIRFNSTRDTVNQETVVFSCNFLRSSSNQALSFHIFCYCVCVFILVFVVIGREVKKNEFGTIDLFVC